MGNHASVIIVFSSVDHLACDPFGHEPDDGQRRCAQIAEFISQRVLAERFPNVVGHTYRHPYHVSPGCGAGALGMACEVVMLFHYNHFGDGYWLREFLRTLPWSKPEEVGMFWKTEEDDRYNVAWLA